VQSHALFIGESDRGMKIRKAEPCSAVARHGRSRHFR
jgi:hypothetical protein